MSRRRAVVVLLVVVLTGSLALEALAAERMAFRQDSMRKLTSGSRVWKNVASVPFTPPEDGYVVVTASGMVGFDAEVSSLTLSLDTKPAVRGPWVFTLTPGYQLFQTYSVRYVFPVKTGVKNTFYLNGLSWDGFGRSISIENGSITVEFYASGNVRAFGVEAMKSVQAAPGDERGNE